MTFYIKQNDTSPVLQATLKDSSGNVINISGASARLHIQDYEGSLVLSSAMEIVDELGGVVKYSWQSGDTSDSGSYYAEIQVDYAYGSVETFPNTGNLPLVITRELN